MKKIILCLCLLLVGCQKQTEKPVAKEEPTKEEVQTVQCTFVGDLLYEQPYYDWIEDDSNDKGYYDLVRPYFAEDDLSIGNLEVPIGGKEIGISGVGYNFNASKDIGNQVASNDFEVLSTANNHANDRGNTGLMNTLDFLKEKDIMAVGTYYDQEDRDAGKYKTIHGIKFGFVSYTYATNQIVSSNNKEKIGLFNRPSDRQFTDEYKQLLTKEINETRKNCDVLIAMMHWGTEFTYELNSQQKELAQFLSDLGVDIIIGNHPHCSQTMEWINNKTLCMYSLGNFVSADHIVLRTGEEFRRSYNVSLMVSLSVQKKGNQISINNVGYIPVINYFDQSLQNFKLVPLHQYSDELEKSHYQYKIGFTKKWINDLYDTLIPSEFPNLAKQ